MEAVNDTLQEMREGRHFRGNRREVAGCSGRDHGITGAHKRKIGRICRGQGCPLHSCVYDGENQGKWEKRYGSIFRSTSAALERTGCDGAGFCWALVFSIPLGLIICSMRMSKIAPVRWFAQGYIVLFRGRR